MYTRLYMDQEKKLERLNKWLVAAGYCSRREADRLITAGAVTVDGLVATLGLKVTGTEDIRVHNKHITANTQKPIYIAYNKPIGIICTSDKNARDNIIDSIGYPERIFHIGRLDVASSGLILLTNNGDIVNKILRAQGGHEKEYLVTVDKPITSTMLEHLANGVMLDGRLTLPAKVSAKNETSFSITIIEGRNRQIRRMCEACGYAVVSLKRIRIMHISLGNMKTGEWRHLTPGEEKELVSSLC